MALTIPPPPSVVDVLVAARKLIELPEHWTQHETARTFDDVPTTPNSPCAEKFCIGGAVVAVNPSGAVQALVVDLLAKAIGESGAMGVVEWNDSLGRTHAEALQAYDRAIELAKEAA